MNAPRKRNDPRGSGPEAQSSNTNAKSSTVRRYAVIITGTRKREWGRYSDRGEAESATAKLRKFGFDAHTVEARHD